MMGNPPRRRPAPSDGDVGREARCASCQGLHPDLQLLGCGCQLHATCLPPSTLQRAREAGGHAQCPPPSCPACSAPLSRLRILPLRTSTLEEAAVERDRDGPAEESNSTSLSSSSGPGGRMGSLVSPTGRHSPGGYGGCAGPSPSARLLGTAPPRTYRTGRWSAEESSLVDRLMSWFESGRLPLPNGVRLNEFLCDMLACRTSRLTKKLKNARLSARAYRVRRPGGDAYAGLGGEWAGLGGAAQRGSSGAAEREVGRDVQHAQGLFIKGVSGPAWVRNELQFNVSRLWRTHLANFCLQIGFEDVDTTEWFATLDSVDYVLATLDGSNVSARRKRMRAAIEEDAASARRGSFDESVPSGLAPPVPGTGPPSPDRGVFVGGVAFDRLTGRAAAAPGPPAERGRDRVDSVVSVVRRDRVDSVLSEISAFDGKRVTMRLGMERIDSQGSFAEFLTEDGGGGAQRQEKRARSGSYQLDPPCGEERPPESRGAADGAPGTAAGAPAPLRAESAEVDYAIDRSIDSVLGTSSGPLSSAPSDVQGQFLGRVGDYLTSSDCPFQHADLWVPIDTSRPDLLGHEHVGSTGVATSAAARGGVSGVIYGGARQAPPVRLTNAGYVTARGLGPRLTNSLNEFGMYSKNFSFSPGFGLPGKVYLSRIRPLWEGSLGLQSKETFARVGGARVYGVNTCVCFPVSTPIGTMVVGLYSMARLVRDARVESECMRYLCSLRPEPRWKLTIDVAADDEAQQQSTEDAGGGSRGGAPDVPPSPPRRTSPPPTAFLIPPSPQSQQQRLESPVTFSGAPPRVDAAPAAARARGPAEPAAAPALARRASDGVPPLAFRDNEDGLAALLRELPSRARPEGGRDGDDPLDSLRAMLSRDPAARNAAESKMVEIVSARFRTHVRSGLGREGVAAGVAADWARIVSAAARFRRSRAEQRRKASPPVAATAGVGQLAYASHQISMEGSGNDAPSISSSTLSVGSLPLAGFQPRPGCETEGARGPSTVEGTGNESLDELKPPARSQGDVPRVISNQSVKSEG